MDVLEITDWGDMKIIDEMQNEAMNDDNNDDQSNTDNNGPNQGMNAANNENFEQNKKEGNESNKFGVIDWNDLRKFDDDHDDDWFKVQEKQLAVQYGGNFIKVKYAEHGRVVYYCELCLAECNAKKSLELHCNGMKHLKKKDLWEKEGKPQPQVPITSGMGPGPGKQKASKPKRWRSPDFCPTAPSSVRYGRSRSRSPPYYGRPRSRSRERFLGDRRHIDPYMGLMDDRDFPKRPYSGPLDRYQHSPPRLGLDERPWLPGSRHGRFSPERRAPRDNYMRGPSPGRMPARARLSPPVSHRVRYDDSRSRRGGSPLPRYSDAPAPPSPPKFTKTNLVSSPAGSLLQKLAECCVKSADDAELALSVVASLVKSLKEYSEASGETKIAELLMDAELKVGTVKALKVGMKMLSSFGGSTTPNPSVAMDLFSALSQGNRNVPVTSAPTQNLQSAYNSFLGSINTSGNQNYPPGGNHQN